MDVFDASKRLAGLHSPPPKVGVHVFAASPLARLLGCCGASADLLLGADRCENHSGTTGEPLTSRAGVAGG